MPEGDTIHRAAATLRKVLEGQVVRSAALPRHQGPNLEAIDGQRVASVRASGKHLLIAFENQLVLRSHMRMTGSWHLYRPGERWRKPRARARAALETSDWIAVCFNAPDVQLLRSAANERALAEVLGPDLLAPEFDAAAVARRWASVPELPIGVALMRQHLAAGIGNVYKSEVLFLQGIDPFAPVRQLSHSTLEGIAACARSLMSANLGPGRRTTRRSLDGEPLWVYGRSGRPCRRCHTVVRMRRQGSDGRSTYFCPICQASGPATRAFQPGLESSG
ncbi:MAG: DNA-formamidopyrimidine glycosylase family protein [Gemmatimonadota bacterium]